MSLFVPDKRHEPVMPCSEQRARLLLQRGKAVVHRRVAFTIRLKGASRRSSPT
ncbi:MAG: RRXRR domain-containing protein [Alphaproteobacteria bacterium]|nr:RRXRR domain-containing protein [Alphaproteobacteria bacterium]